MSTFMANKANIERKWYILDAAGKPLGKTAVRAADLLRGKTKVTYTPNADCGDNVIIINAGQAVLTARSPSRRSIGLTPARNMWYRMATSCTSASMYKTND